MSLYGFFDSYVQETPELLSVRAAPTQKYDDMLLFFKNRMRKLPIDSFYDMLFYQTINKNSTNLRENEILRLKVKRLGMLTQKQFNIIASSEREKTK